VIIVSSVDRLIGQARRRAREGEQVANADWVYSSSRLARKTSERQTYKRKVPSLKKE
jgi:hypothetical protein